MERIRYGKVYPKKFGTMIAAARSPDVTVSERDIEILETLQDRFWEKEGDVLSWKNELAPIAKEIEGLHTTLETLWMAGVVLKFAKSFHTQSGRPQYIQWYIWEEEL